MTQLCVVVLLEQGYVYGPLSEQEALGFAAYLTREVDPAEVRPLQSPVADLLTWREQVARPVLDRWPDCATPDDCPLGPEPHKFIAPADDHGAMICCRQPWEAK